MTVEKEVQVEGGRTFRFEVKAESHTNRTTKLAFTSYKVLDKSGKWIDCRFRKEVANIPASSCIMIVKSENCNIALNGKYPVLWVKAIERTEALFVPNLAEEEAKLEEYFG